MTTFKIPISKPDLGKEEEEAVINVLKSSWPSQGKITEEFEARLSYYLSSNVTTVNNGSSALLAALIGHEIKPGDKVVVPAFTFVASSSIPKILGAEIIVADINQETLNVEPETIENLVKYHDVKSVITVDVGGQPGNIEAFEELSKRYKFVLIEDAAQSFGAE